MQYFRLFMLLRWLLKKRRLLGALVALETLARLVWRKKDHLKKKQD